MVQFMVAETGMAYQSMIAHKTRTNNVLRILPGVIIVFITSEFNVFVL
jgi:hypothetical protein